MAAPAPAPLTPANAGAPAPTGERLPVVVVEYRAAQPCAQQCYFEPTPVQAVRAIAERLGLPPVSLGFRVGPLWETDVFSLEDHPHQRTPTLASITRGLAVSEALAARNAAAQGALR